MKSSIHTTLYKAKKAYSTGSKEVKAALTEMFGEDFHNINAADHINLFEDVLAFNDLTLDQFNTMHAGLSPDTYAYEQIKLIVLAYNEGENVPLEETGYYPYFIKRASGRGLAFGVVYYDDSSTGVGPRLWYKTADLARKAGTKFESIYIDFFTK